MVVSLIGNKCLAGRYRVASFPFALTDGMGTQPDAPKGIESCWVMSCPVPPSDRCLSGTGMGNQVVLERDIENGALPE